jgi:hypothetical protein
MPKKRKQYKDYDDYIASPEWKDIKEEFYSKYEGFVNVCQISGRLISDEDDEYMCLHHWRYSKNWNDDNISNLILIGSDTHDWIHSNYSKGDIDEDEYNTIDRYKGFVMRNYNNDRIIDAPDTTDLHHDIWGLNDTKKRNEKSIKKLLLLIDNRDNHIKYLINDVSRLQSIVDSYPPRIPLQPPVI